jgi:PhzF family phenazine biosynthesis protein
VPGQDAPAPTIVAACLRAGRGGSPTAVLHDRRLTDRERRELPKLAGTSHVAFVSVSDETEGELRAALRFFTRAGELPACGHGTVAALAFLAEELGHREYQLTLAASGRSFRAQAVENDGGVEAWFDPGTVEVREAAREERSLALDCLGETVESRSSGICVASLGRPRLLVPIASRLALAELRPDFVRLREECDRLGLLGCYVHTPPTGEGRLAARMFAPSICVPEDVANANSTACLAARLGEGQVSVDMGDSLGRPSTIIASARKRGRGLELRVGGTAKVVSRWAAGANREPVRGAQAAAACDG